MAQVQGVCLSSQNSVQQGKSLGYIMALPEEANGKTIQKAGEMAPWLRALAMPWYRVRLISVSSRPVRRGSLLTPLQTTTTTTRRTTISSCCFCRRPRFGPQHQHGSLQPLITTDEGDLIPLLTSMCTTTPVKSHRYMLAKHLYTLNL